VVSFQELAESRPENWQRQAENWTTLHGELLTRTKAKLTERQRFASGEQLAQIKGKLKGIEARLSTEPSAAHPLAYLLGFDTRGNGHAIVAMGDPDTAANVATYVPGTHARLGNLHEGLVRSDRMVQAARQAGSDWTSVIAWYGYNAPQSLWQAEHISYGHHATGKLDSFQSGLRVTHGGPPAPRHRDRAQLRHHGDRPSRVREQACDEDSCRILSPAPIAGGRGIPVRVRAASRAR
jgi:hypothetical protein